MAYVSMASGPSERPMVDLNTTPLIDVMLVLLIMFIITIPLQSHAVKIDLPGDQPQLAINDLKNRVTLDRDGVAAWNGQPVSDRELSGLLTAATRMDSEPETHFAPDAQARYERVDELLVLMRSSGVTKLGFVGNEGYAAAF